MCKWSDVLRDRVVMSSMHEGHTLDQVLSLRRYECDRMAVFNNTSTTGRQAYEPLLYTVLFSISDGLMYFLQVLYTAENILLNRF